MRRVGRAAFAGCVASSAALGIVYTWSEPAAPPAAHVSAPPARDHPLHAATAMPAGLIMGHGVSAPEHGPPLPSGAEHGLAHRLVQYPAVFRATPRQRATAEQLRRRLYAAARRLADPRAATAAGFSVVRARRAPGEHRVMWLHVENRRWHAARGAALDPSHPDTLIYADLPGKPLRLVGVMISMPRGLRGPAVGGPITRWHDHLVCVAGDERGLAPRPDGTCPAGAKLGIGSEMMHVWFTRDLRSAYAIHAPWPELCAARLLPAATCASGRRFVGM